MQTHRASWTRGVLVKTLAPGIAGMALCSVTTKYRIKRNKIRTTMRLVLVTAQLPLSTCCIGRHSERSVFGQIHSPAVTGNSKPTKHESENQISD